MHVGYVKAAPPAELVLPAKGLPSALVWAGHSGTAHNNQALGFTRRGDSSRFLIFRFHHPKVCFLLLKN